MKLYSKKKKKKISNQFVGEKKSGVVYMGEEKYVYIMMEQNACLDGNFMPYHIKIKINGVIDTY